MRDALCYCSSSGAQPGKGSCSRVRVQPQPARLSAIQRHAPNAPVSIHPWWAMQCKTPRQKEEQKAVRCPEKRAWPLASRVKCKPQRRVTHGTSIPRVFPKPPLHTKTRIARPISPRRPSSRAVAALFARASQTRRGRYRLPWRACTSCGCCERRVA